MAEMNCPNDGHKCLIDPVALEGRLVRIETKLDQLLKDNSGAGISGKAVAGYSTLITGFVVGAVEALRAYFQAKGN